MRLFIGIPLPHDVAVNLSGLMLQRANIILYPKASIPPPEGLHITLKFIGEVDEAYIPTIISSLSDAIHHQRIGSKKIPLSPLDISIDKAGAFLRTGIVYANVVPTPALSALAALVEETLHKTCSLPKEKRPYHPHITLARLQHTRTKPRDDRQRTSGRASVESVGNDGPHVHGFEVKHFTAMSFALYQSRRAASEGGHGRNSNVYEVLHSWDLGSQ